jgi:hypothetical protein
MRGAFAQCCAVAAGLFFLVANAAAVRSQTIESTQRAPARMTEFRGYSSIGWGLEDDIWRLAHDGRATLVFQRLRGSGRGSERIEGGDAGTWSMRGDELCVNWNSRRDISGCYRIIKKFGIHVRLIGPVTFEGTLESWG